MHEKKEEMFKWVSVISYGNVPLVFDSFVYGKQTHTLNPKKQKVSQAHWLIVKLLTEQDETETEKSVQLWKELWV